MRIRSTFTFVAIVLSFVVAQSAVYAQDGSAKREKSKPASTSQDAIVFPEVDGWEKGDVRQYPTAELGYSIPYRSEIGDVVTIYVYNAGLKNIPSDTSHKTLKDQIAQARNDVFEMGKAGHYKNVKDIKSETVTLGGTGGKVAALFTLMSYSYQDQEMDSAIYLFGHRNTFVKIRASRPKTPGASISKDFADLFAAIDATFSK